jgi:hypothetical protein
MHCQNCGAEVLEGDQYCQSCGTPVGDGTGVGGTGQQGTHTRGAQAAGHGQGGTAHGGQQGARNAQQPQYGGGQGGHARNTQQPQHGGRGPTDSGTLVVRTEADKYLKRFAWFNLALAILSAFFGLLFVALGEVIRSMAGVPTGMEALFGVFYVIMFGIAALYLGVWYFARRRSAVAVYGGTVLYGIGTVLNAVSLNIIGFPITLLGLYWGYKSFDAV